MWLLHSIITDVNEPLFPFEPVHMNLVQTMLYSVFSMCMLCSSSGPNVFFLLLFVTQWCCGKTKCMEGLDEILSIDNTSYIHIIYIDIYIYIYIFFFLEILHAG